MEKKLGLNNTQRKMLDEIYTEQFDKLVAPIMRKRSDGLELLKRRILQKEATTNPMKSVLAALKGADTALKGAEKYMEENGLRFSGYYSRSRDDHTLSFADGWSGRTHPQIQKYQEETTRIEIDLAKKRKEIRARIYGLDATYEQVESEISRELASIKV